MLSSIKDCLPSKAVFYLALTLPWRLLDLALSLGYLRMEVHLAKVLVWVVVVASKWLLSLTLTWVASSCVELIIELGFNCVISEPNWFWKRLPIIAWLWGWENPRLIWHILETLILYCWLSWMILRLCYTKKYIVCIRPSGVKSIFMRFTIVSFKI